MNPTPISDLRSPNSDFHDYEPIHRARQAKLIASEARLFFWNGILCASNAIAWLLLLFKSA